MLTTIQSIKSFIHESLPDINYQLKIIDNSSKHHGHLEVSNKTGITHVHICLVSDLFENMSLLERHRFLFSILKRFNLHAIEIVAKTFKEMEKDGLPFNTNSR
jgi:stress-induced morphogen